MSRKATVLILVIIFTVSAFSITLFLKPIDIFSPSPIYTDDYSMHFAQCLSTKRFLSSFGKCWGYDPFLLAGFPRQTLANADNKAWELLFFLLSPILGDGFAFKIFVLSFLLSYPFLIYAAARNFKLPRETSLIAAVLSIIFFHSSLAIDFVFVGMISYAFVCFFSIYYFSLFYRLLHNFSWQNYFITAWVGSLLLLLHILSVFTAAIPILILYSCFLKKLTTKQHIAVLSIPLVVLLLNSPWLILIFEFLNDKTVRPENWEFSFQLRNVFEPIYVYLFQQKSFYPRAIPVEGFNCNFIDAFLLLFSCYTFWLWYKRRQYRLLVTFTGNFLFFFLVTYYGSHTSFFSQFQPERFSTPLNLFLMIPACIGVNSVMKGLLRGRKTLEVLFIVSLSFVLLYRPFMRPFVKIAKYNLFRVSCAFPKELNELLQFLDENTSRKGRILIEDSEFAEQSREHAYYGGHYPALFPDHVRREYLCGPRPLYPIKHSYASFTNGLLFEKNISNITSEEMKHLFTLYNVKWIVCWMQKSKDVFNRYPEFLKKLKDIDKFTVYEVLREPTFFIKGQGRVAADYNRIALRDVVADDDDEIIISYHWMQKLKTEPPIALEKAVVGDDPVGFIKLINPPSQVVIYNAY